MEIHRLRELTGSALSAGDGEIGRLSQVYFDDETWTVRHFVVRTGGWLRGREVLVSPHALGRVHESDGTIAVELTREQIEHGAPAEDVKTVSRHYAEMREDHHLRAPWWAGPPAGGVALPPVPRSPVDVERRGRREDAPQPHLRSSEEVCGYHLHALDGTIGHVADLLLDDAHWTVRYLEVDTRSWIPGRKVLLAPTWIERVSWGEREVFVKLPREAVRSAPAYDPSARVGPVDEIRLLEHYGGFEPDGGREGTQPERRRSET